MTDTVTWQSMLNQVREERDALAADLANEQKDRANADKVGLQYLARIRTLEAKARDATRHYRCETCLMYFPLHRADCHHAPQSETSAQREVE